MGVKARANKAKGKRSIDNDDDSDFGPVTKSVCRPPQKKSKFVETENGLFPEAKNHMRQESNKLIDIYFPVNKLIDHKSIEDAKRWGDDIFLGLKTIVLYFIHCFLLSNTPKKELARLLKLKNMRPTDEEKKILHLDGLFDDDLIYDRASIESTFDFGSTSKESVADDIDLLKFKVNSSKVSQNFESKDDDEETRDEKSENIKRDFAADDDDDSNAGGSGKDHSDDSVDANEDFDEDGGDLGGSGDDDVSDRKDVDVSEKKDASVLEIENDKPKDDENAKRKGGNVKDDNSFKRLCQLDIEDDEVVMTEVPTSLIGDEVYKSDATVFEEEEDDTLPCTPLLDKRKRAPMLKSHFVDFGSSDLKSSGTELLSSSFPSARDEQEFKIVTYVNGLYALDDAISDPVSSKLEVKFDDWIKKGRLKYPR
uniref:Uncharacterized protein n=1 Tax=Cannabis sativa TaxID=3483 RepID=A0A803NL75_CANSA